MHGFPGRARELDQIKITGKEARRIHITGRAMRRIEPADFAKALGAEPVNVQAPAALDPIALGAIGNELLKRLRSTGGRPALEDADQICKVPLSADDIAALEKIGQAVAKRTGTRPSVGQVASVLLRRQLQQPQGASADSEMREMADCFFQASVSALRW